MTVPNRLLRLALVGVLAATAHAAVAAGRIVVRVDQSRCVAVDAEWERMLPDQFGKYRKFTKVCGVGPSPKKPALYLVSVWVDDYYSAQPGTPTAEDIPLPVLMTRQGSKVGTLPLSFPGEGPLSVAVTFSDWRSDWPHQVRMAVSTAAVGDPPKLAPLYWHSADKRFIDTGAQDNGRRK